MIETLACERNTTASVIEDSMTPAQIELRYFFYLRERHRDAQRIADAVLVRLFGKGGSV